MALGIGSDDCDKKISFGFNQPNQQPAVDTEQNDYHRKFGNLDIFSAAATGGGINK